MLSALALTPAAIANEAKVRRQSWNVRRSRPAAADPSSARACAFLWVEGTSGSEPEDQVDARGLA